MMKVILALGCLLLASTRDTAVLAFTPHHYHATTTFGRAIAPGVVAPLHRPSDYSSVLRAPSACRLTLVEKNKFHQRSIHSLPILSSTNSEDDDLLETEDDTDNDGFSVKTTIALIGGQSLLIVGAAGVAALIGTPNWGFGPGMALDWQAIRLGSLLALPLGVFAAALDLIEDRFPALQDVTTATQRSVLALLGSSWKPRIALATATALGLAAGVGEELMFRGVMQYELAGRFGSSILAMGLSSVIFGALHAVTPLYAGLATLASIYFGYVYNLTGNLAVPMVCHAVYDVGALMFAHWTVSRLSDSEREAIANWDGPTGDAVL